MFASPAFAVLTCTHALDLRQPLADVLSEIDDLMIRSPPKWHRCSDPLVLVSDHDPIDVRVDGADAAFQIRNPRFRRVTWLGRIAPTTQEPPRAQELAP